MYGLVDAPLLFQLALLMFMIQDLAQVQSFHDDNYLYISEQWNIHAIVIIHVDDILIFATEEYLHYFRAMIEKRFGKLKRHQPPFVYLGIRYQFLTPSHSFLDQEEYLMKLKPIPVDANRAKNDSNSLYNTKHFALQK